MFLAKVGFYKYAQKDSLIEGHGYSGDSLIVSSSIFHVEFADSDDLIQQLAQWTTERFDVQFEDMHKNMSNEIGNKFEYCQNENADGDKIELTETNPNGYFADYEFFIDDVYIKVEYNFTTGGIQ